MTATTLGRSVLARIAGWVRSVITILREAYERWRADRAIRLGAGLAYYGLFTAVPLLTSAIGIAGLVFSESAIESFLIDSLEAIVSEVPGEIVAFIERLADSIDRTETSSGLAVSGLVVAIFGGSLLFIALQDALNVIWDIPVHEGLRFTVRRRLIAFGIVMLAGVVLLASLTLQTIALVVDGILQGNAGKILNLNDLLITMATWGIGLVSIALLFQLLVEEHLDWRNTFIVSALIGILMVVGTWAVGFYFNGWGSASLSGVSGGLVVILTWFYYLAQIVIAGAVLLKTLEDRRHNELERQPW